MKAGLKHCLLCLPLVLLGASAEAAESDDTGNLNFIVGMDYSRGNYGLEEDTDMLFVPVTAKYTTLPWTLKVTVPYLRITGPSNVVGGGDSTVVVDNANTDRRTVTGVGDVVASVGYDLTSSPLVTLTGKVKFGTADADKNLGTGETDYYLQLDIAKAFGNFTGFGTTGYRWVTSPDAYELNNSAYVSAGGAWKFAGKMQGGVIYDYRQATSDGAGDVSEALWYISRKGAHGRQATGYIVTGFSDGSPDIGVGWQMKF